VEFDLKSISTSEALNMPKRDDINVVFMGTPDFAAYSLKELDRHFKVSLVITQADKRKGRGKAFLPTPVKMVANELGLDVITPEKIKSDEESINLIEALKPDFIVVVAYGQILSKRILDIPKYGSINLHASLLPLLRGAAPIQASIIKGFDKTGNTTMFMAEGLDTGDMLLKNTVNIPGDMTYGMLHDELMKTGAELLVHTLLGLKEGKINREPQNDGIATYVPKMSKEDALIDFEDISNNILNKIRGYNPTPLAYTYQDGKLIKIVSAVKGDAKGVPGKILGIDKEGITVGTKDGSIIIKELQIPGKKTMKVRDFLNGNKLDSNKLFSKE